MGVSGSGKTTIGKELSGTLGFKFIEGDSFHSAENIETMSSGKPLSDSQREPWLRMIRKVMDENLHTQSDCVVACSALSIRSRKILGIDRKDITVVFLMAPKNVIARRLSRRQNHFMHPDLLDSQFNDLEQPNSDEVIPIKADRNISSITKDIIKNLDGL
jgi:gluconokinase